jgi:5-methylcytosine-specific restriction protein A
MRGKLSRALHTEKGICRWCGEPVPKGRHSWCSDRCVEAFKVEAWPNEMRTAIAKRDHEICRLCGRDCGRIDLYIEAIVDNPKALPKRTFDYTSDQYVVIDPDPVLARRRQRWINLLRRLRMWMPDCYGSADHGMLRHLWEADHIVPVIEGGSNRLDNMRTLCVPCHKAETRELRQRLSRARAH